MFGRKQAAVVGGEFLGTGLLSVILLSVHGSNIGQLAYFFAIAGGLAVAALTMIFAGSGAGHFNPAVTVGMWAIRQVKTLPAVTFIAAQLLGAWAAYYVYTYFIGTQLPLSTLTPQPVLFWMEAAGAFILALAFAAMVFGRATDAKRALVVGVAYALAIMVASHYTQQLGELVGIVNPALAVSMRTFTVFGSLGWGVYAFGPLVGALVGFVLYDLLFAPESALVHAGVAVGSRVTSSRSVSASATTAAAKTAPKRRAVSTTRVRKTKTARTRK